MEHLFGRHEQYSRKYAKERAKSRRGKTASYSSSLDLSGTQVTTPDMIMERIESMRYRMYQAPGRSKWERIGKPMLMNTFDQFIVLNPLLTPKMRLAAATRQADEFMRHYERSGLGF